MAIALAGTGTLYESASATSVVVPYPTGITAGEILLLHAADSGTTITSTPPTGFTLADVRNTTNSSPSVVVFYRVADGTESGSVTCNTGIAAGRVSGMMERWSGVDNTTPLDATPVDADSPVSTTFVMPSITTVTNGAVLVHTIGLNAASASDIVTLAGTTLIQDTTGTGRRMGTYYETQATAGASGTRTWSETSATTLQWAGITLALRPASTSGTNYTASPADTASGADSAATQMDVVQTGADTGAGSDASSFVADNVRSIADTGSGTDGTTNVRSVSNALSDTGSGADAAGLIQTNVRTASDTGSGTDAVVTSFVLLQSPADTGSGSDAVSFVITIARTAADTGSGTDSASFQQSQFTVLADTGGGSDSASQVQSQAKSLADTGAGSDSASALIILLESSADTGGGADTATIVADNVRSITDTGGGTDSAATLAALVRGLADSGVGTESVTIVRNVSVTVGDTGTGSDVVTAHLGSSYRDLVITGAPLPTRWIIAELDSRWTITPLPARFAATLNAGDTMATDVIVSAGAAKYVGGTITESTGKDITADTFQISLGSDTNPGTWLTPDVSSVGTTNAQRIVKLLVSSGVPTGLIPGTYWVWVRVTDSPEIEPIRVQGPVTVR